MAAGTVSATFDARQHPGGQDRPGSRSFLDGRVLTCAGYDDSIRLAAGRAAGAAVRAPVRLAAPGPGQPPRGRRAGRLTLSYAELDARANQLARFLVRRQGVRPGDRIGLLFDRAVDGYVGMLAVLKASAAYVPLDAGFPPDRLAYIASDAGVRLVLSRSHLARARRGRWRARSPAVPRPGRSGSAGAQSTDRLGRRRARRAGRRPLLHHLHLGLDRPAQGRRDRARQHLQLRSGRRRGLRRSARTTASTRA